MMHAAAIIPKYVFTYVRNDYEINKCFDVQKKGVSGILSFAYIKHFDFNKVLFVLELFVVHAVKMDSN